MTHETSPSKSASKRGSRSAPVPRKKYFGRGLPYTDLDDLNGHLVVIEGSDGVGRSTQIRLLKSWLQIKGFGGRMGLQIESVVKAQKARTIAKVKEVYPDVEEILTSQHFAEWFSKQPHYIQAAAMGPAFDKQGRMIRPGGGVEGAMMVMDRYAQDVAANGGDAGAAAAAGGPDTKRKQDDGVPYEKENTEQTESQQSSCREWTSGIRRGRGHPG